MYIVGNVLQKNVADRKSVFDSHTFLSLKCTRIQPPEFTRKRLEYKTVSRFYQEGILRTLAQ